VKNQLWLIGIATILLAWLVVLPLFARTDVQPLMPIFLMIVSVILTTPVFVTAHQGRLDAIEPVWLLTAIYGISFWLRPLLVLYDVNKRALPYVTYDSGAMTLALAACVLGLSAFYLGYYSSVGRSIVPKLPNLRWPWERWRVVTAIIAFGAVFTILSGHFLEKGQYSIEYMYVNRALVNWGDGDLVQLLHMAGWVVVVLVFSLFVMRPANTLAAVGVLVAAISMVLIPLSFFGARWTLFFIVGCVLIMWHNVVCRFSARQWVMIFIGFFVLSALFGVFRSHLDFRELLLEDVLEYLVLEVSQYSDWDLLAEIIQIYPQFSGHTYGVLGLETFFWLVPRRIWPTKPEWYGTTLIQQTLFPGMLEMSAVGFTGSYLGTSIVGEGYVEFGWLGVVVYMFLSGVIWRLVYRFKNANRGRLPAEALYAVLIIGIPTYVRSFVSSILLMLVWSTGAAIVFRCLETSEQRSHFAAAHARGRP
jgi:hypothetical protein